MKAQIALSQIHRNIMIIDWYVNTISARFVEVNWSYVFEMRNVLITYICKHELIPSYCPINSRQCIKRINAGNAISWLLTQ